MIPDSRCDKHLDEVLIVTATVNRGKAVNRVSCRACRREWERGRNGAKPKTSRYAERCRNGHLKRFHYRRYGGQMRCVTCTKDAGRAKR